MSVPRYLTALVLLLLPGCTTEGLAFVRDDRVEIVEPSYREALDLPATVDWEINDPDLTAQIGDDILFGVYLDIDPQPPDESLDYFGRDDPACKPPGCPDEKYLRQLGIYTTSETEMSWQQMPIAPGVDLERGQSDVHEVNLVLLDRSGNRIGESAWHIVFEIERTSD